MQDSEIREAIDACQSGGDDLRSPALSPLAEVLACDPRWQTVYQRSQRCDAAIRRAVQDVPVPAGLCERLLTVAAESTPAAVASAPLVSEQAVSEPLDADDASLAASPTRPPVAWRRYWKSAVVATAAAAALALMLLHRAPGPLPELNDDFSGEVIGWTEQASEYTWNDDLQAATLPLDSGVRAVPRRWSILATSYDRRTLIYDLTPAGREFVYAFCIPLRGRSSELPSLPPATPFSTTGGVAIGVWQNQDIVYVLAVRGGRSRYQTMIDSRILIGRVVQAVPARI
jgi:hypothetical protein